MFAGSMMYAGKLTARLAYKGAGAQRARGALHEIAPSMGGKGVFHVHRCFPQRFGLIVNDG